MNILFRDQLWFLLFLAKLKFMFRSGIYIMLILCTMYFLLSSCGTSRTAVNSYSPGEANASAYIDKYKDLAISEMKRTGVPASITLAQGMIE